MNIRARHFGIAAVVIIGLDLVSSFLFGKTDVTGFQIVVSAFIAAWITEGQK